MSFYRLRLKNNIIYCDDLALKLIERKSGVLLSSSIFPTSKAELHKYIKILKSYQNLINRPMVRICFKHDTDQDMLLLQAPNSYTPPIYQLDRTITYEVIEGEMEVFLFDKEFVPKNRITLRSGATFEQNSGIPRAMVFGNSQVTFREKFKGDFKDEYTHWPFGRNGQNLPVENLVALFQEAEIYE